MNSIHLMDSNRDAKGLGHGTGYLYPHNFPEHHVSQQYLPDSVSGGFYEPTEQGYEKEIKARLEKWQKNSAENPG